MIEALKAVADLGSETGLVQLLTILSEITTFSLIHQHLDLLQEHGNKGSVPAMLSLAKVHFNRRDKKSHNYKVSARWMHFSQGLAPDDQQVSEVFFPAMAEAVGPSTASSGRLCVLPGMKFPGQRSESAHWFDAGLMKKDG